MFDTSTSFDAIGFLSPELKDFIQECRRVHSIWFRLAEDINRTCQLMLSEFKPGKEVVVQHLFAILFHVRTLSNFQGTILLAEGGMTVEARTLARCMYENVFCVATLRKEPDKFISEMEEGEQASTKSKARWLLQEPARLDFSGPNAADKLRERVEQMDKRWGKLSPLEWKRLAERGGVGDAYLYYKVLSGDAAHPSISALDRYIIAGRGATLAGVRFAPDIDSVQDSLNCACNAAIMVGLAVAEVVGNDARQRELTSHVKVYAKLNGM